MDDHFFTSWGFWITLAGTVLGLTGFIYGIWARSHPKHGRLVYRITESPLVPTGTSADTHRLRVRLDEEEIADPYVAVIELINAGPGDLSPDAFSGGRFRITTTGDTGDPSPTLVGNLSVGVTGVLTDSRPVYPQKVGNVTITHASVIPAPFHPSYFDLDPLQIKQDQTVTITLLFSGQPSLGIRASLTDFDVARVEQVKDYDFSLELPTSAITGRPTKLTTTIHRRR